MVSATTRTRIHYTDNERVYYKSILHHLDVSVLLPGTTKFSSLLNLAYRTRVTRPDGHWSDETTNVGLTLDKITAKELEFFVCGSSDPTTAQSFILLRSILLSGMNEFIYSCREQLIM